MRTLPIRPRAAKRRSLLPAATVTREWPVNVVPSDEALFHREIVRRLHPVRIRTVRAAKVIPGLGPCYWSGAISEAHPQSPRWRTKARRAIAWWSTSAQQSGSDELFWITDTYSHQYFHWITDVLPKLHLICKSFSKCDILLPNEYVNVDLVMQSLQSFPEASISYVPDKKSISVPSLKLLSSVPPTGNFNPKIISELRLRLLHYFGAPEIEAERRGRAETGIYISRAKAKQRRIVNEISVVNTIEALGYGVAFMEDLSFGSQVKLMQGTKVLLGLHGAGLTNMLFMPAGSVIVEIRKEGDVHNNCYFSLASALGHTYYYIIAQVSQNGRNRNDFPPWYFADDVFVDVRRLSTVLRQVGERLDA